MSFPEQASKDLPDGSRVNVQPEEGNSLEELLSHVTCRVHRAGFALPRLPQWKVQRETAPSYILWLCVGGSSDHQIGGRPYRQESGDLLLVPPNVPVEGSHDPSNPAHVYVLQFAAHLYGVLDVAAVFGLPVHLRPAPDRMEHMVGAVHEIVRELRARQRGYVLAANAACARLLVLIYREAVSQGIDGTSAGSQPRKRRPRTVDVERLAPVFLTIQARHAEPLTLADLAAVLHVHPAHFSALFKRVTGFPPRAYLTQYRLDRVRELLLSTDLPIARIAQQAGFSDQSYLSRVFRAGEGSSPTEYRARNTLSKS